MNQETRSIKTPEQPKPQEEKELVRFDVARDEALQWFAQPKQLEASLRFKFKEAGVDLPELIESFQKADNTIKEAQNDIDTILKSGLEQTIIPEGSLAQTTIPEVARVDDSEQPTVGYEETTTYKDNLPQTAIPEISRVDQLAQKDIEDIESRFEDKETLEAQEYQERSKNFANFLIERLKTQSSEARAANNDELVSKLEQRILDLEWKLLEEAKLRDDIRTPESTEGQVETIWNEVNKIRFENGAEAAYKPSQYEAHQLAQNYGIEGGGLYKREWLADQFSRALGWDIVPTTIVRKADRGIGSMQKWERGDLAKTIKWKENMTPEKTRLMEQLAIFDFITNNTDRNAGNFLITRSGNLVAIDNGLSFAPTRAEEATEDPEAARALKDHNLFGYLPFRSSPMEYIVKEKDQVSEEFQQNLKDFLADKELQKTVRKLFEESIEKGGAIFDTSLTRMQTLLADGYDKQYNWKELFKARQQKPIDYVKKMREKAKAEKAKKS